MPTEIWHFINGRRVVGRSGRSAPVFDPATGEETGRVPLAGSDEIAEATAAAHAAFPKWAATTPLRRARVLNRFLRLLEDNEERSAAAITAEHGEVLSDAKGEVARGIEVVEFATGAPHPLLRARRLATLMPAAVPSASRSIPPAYSRAVYSSTAGRFGPMPIR